MLLDTLLLHLAWEKECDPDVAACFFKGRRGHHYRLVTVLPKYLSGNWSTHNSGSVGIYFRQVVQLRNRSVHAGYYPSSDEVQLAFGALEHLEHYIGDCLCGDKALAAFPRTALAFLGRDGISRRRSWSQRLDQLTGDPFEPNWSDSFYRWRIYVDRALNPDAPLPGMVAARLDLHAWMMPDGSTSWSLHDLDTHYATILEDDAIQLGKHQRQLLEQLRTWVRKNPVSHPIRVLVTPSRVPTMDGANWCRAGEVYPELTIASGRTPTSPADVV